MVTMGRITAWLIGKKFILSFIMRMIVLPIIKEICDKYGIDSVQAVDILNRVFEFGMAWGAKDQLRRIEKNGSKAVVKKTTDTETGKTMDA
jgi:hypothetical protein